MPHRGISRAYNLVGLADLDPSVRVPGLGAVADLLAGGDLDGVREYEDGEEAVPVTLRGRLRGAREGSGGEIVGRREGWPSGPGAGIWKEEKMSGLAETRCTACQGDEPTLTDAEIGELRPQVPDWRVEERHGVKRLKRAFRFGDFGGALDFTDGVGERAEQAGHHPALLTEWGRVTVTWWTHKIGGLHRNDFVMAARTDELYGASQNETSTGGTMAKILDGKATAAEIRAEVAGEVRELNDEGRSVRLDVILVGEDPASVTYVRNKQNDSAEVGMESRTHAFGDGVSQEELTEVVEGLNEDPEVSGFFIQLPLPEGLDPQPLVSRIRPAKDVDGLNPESAGRLSAGLPSLLPCTPHGIVQLLRRHDVPLEGREAVVLGRSNLVGKPMAQLLLRENATVTVCHSRTGNLAEVAARGDILIVALGRREMVGAEYVKEGAVVVDVGIHRKDGGGLEGDVRFAEVKTKASAITPVPGGVGPMTRAMLLFNTLQAARGGVGG